MEENRITVQTDVCAIWDKKIPAEKFPQGQDIILQKSSTTIAGHP